MQANRREASRVRPIWPFFRGRIDRRSVNRIGERAVNRAAQLLGPMLILADGTLRSLRRYDYGEE